MGLCPKPEDLGLCPNPLRKLLKKFSKHFQNFNPIGFLILFYRCTNFRCSRVPCYCFRLLLLPDRSGRKLVDDWDGTIYFYGECRFIPPHQSLTRQLPPKGKPLHPLHYSQQDGRVEIRKLGCFCNSACFLNFLFTSRNFIHQVRTGV